MPGKKSPGPSVKKPEAYEALKDKGMSKERPAKISTAQAAKEKGKKNGSSTESAPVTIWTSPRCRRLGALAA